MILCRFIEEEVIARESRKSARYIDHVYLSYNNIISFLLSFLESTPTCSMVNYEQTCWSFICCNLHCCTLIKSGLTRASARDCACYSADLIPGKYTYTFSFIEYSHSSREYRVRVGSRYGSMRRVVTCDYERSNEINFPYCIN